jgi:hypothetical protein
VAQFLIPSGTVRQTWAPYRSVRKHIETKGRVAHIDAISAIDSMTKNMPKQTVRNIQIPPAVPPLLKAIPIMTNVYSQVDPRMTA